MAQHDFRLILAAIAAAVLAACGGGGGGGSSPTPVSPVTPAPPPPPAVLVRNQSSSQPLDTSASNPGRLNAGNTATLIVYESGYAGSFNRTILPVSIPAGSKICVNADLVGSGDAQGQYLFVGTTLSQTADPACLFPQTVDIHLTDSTGNAGDLYVKVVTSSNQ